MNEILYVFDVDGVLCNKSKHINRKFKDFFLNWSNDKKYYIATGSPREKTIKQIGIDICKKSDISFHCLGNSIWVNDIETIVNDFELTNYELCYLNEFLNTSKFPYRTGNHINKRTGSYNFSIVGRSANYKQRLDYIKFDKIYMERYHIVREINEKLNRIEAFIGGDISIDICIRGKNKSTIIDYLPKGYIYYFGDSFFEYGIDYPVMEALMIQKNGKIFNIENGYVETKNILETL
jgi:phosphomannomutase